LYWWTPRMLDSGNNGWNRNRNINLNVLCIAN
jgi:hypothetical protein